MELGLKLCDCSNTLIEELRSAHFNAYLAILKNEVNFALVNVFDF